MAIKTETKYADRMLSAARGNAGLRKKLDAQSTVIPEKQRYDRAGRQVSGKVRVTILLTPETIAMFKSTGEGWQARMSDELDTAARRLSV